MSEIAFTCCTSDGHSDLLLNTRNVLSVNFSPLKKRTNQYLFLLNPPSWPRLRRDLVFLVWLDKPQSGVSRIDAAIRPMAIEPPVIPIPLNLLAFFLALFDLLGVLFLPVFQFPSLSSPHTPLPLQARLPCGSLRHWHPIPKPRPASPRMQPQSCSPPPRRVLLNVPADIFEMSSSDAEARIAGRENWGAGVYQLVLPIVETHFGPGGGERRAVAVDSMLVYQI